MAPQIFSYFSKFSSHEKKLLLCIALIYSLSCTTQISFPILFKAPKLICIDKTNIKEYECFEEQICKNDNNMQFRIDRDNGVKSLMADFQMICENQFMYRKCLSIIFGISLIAVFLNFLIILPIHKRSVFFSVCGLFTGISLLLSICYAKDVILISIFIGFASLGYILILTYSFLIINDHFEGERARIAFGFTHIVCGIIGVFYSFLGFLTQSDWIFLNYIVGIPLILISIALIILDEDLEIDLIVLQNELENDHGFLQSLQKVNQNKEIRTNFLIFIFYWFTQVITYYGIPIELESIGGNLYLNISIFALIETLSSFLATELSLKYQFLNLLKIFANFTILFTLPFIFASKSYQGEGNLTIILMVLATFCVEICYDTTWHLFGMYLCQVFTREYYAQFLIIAVTISRFSLIFLPYLNYFAISCNFHPFCLYGIFWLITRFLVSNAHTFQNQEKNLEEKYFEFKSGTVIFDGFEGERNLDVIKRNNKIRPLFEINQKLLNYDENKRFVNNIDEAIGNGRRTLVFEGVELEELRKNP